MTIQYDAAQIAEWEVLAEKATPCPECGAENLWEYTIAFIAAARTAVPALCQLAREQQEAIAKLEAMVAEHTARPGDDEV